MDRVFEIAQILIDLRLGQPTSLPAWLAAHADALHAAAQRVEVEEPRLKGRIEVGAGVGGAILLLEEAELDADASAALTLDLPADDADMARVSMALAPAGPPVGDTDAQTATDAPAPEAARAERTERNGTQEDTDAPDQPAHSPLATEAATEPGATESPKHEPRRRLHGHRRGRIPRCGTLTWRSGALGRGTGRTSGWKKAKPTALLPAEATGNHDDRAQGPADARREGHPQDVRSERPTHCGEPHRLHHRLAQPTRSRASSNSTKRNFLDQPTTPTYARFPT